MPDRIDLEGYSVTAEEAQTAILDYLRDTRGKPVSMWTMLNTLCTHARRSENRREHRFFRAQLTKLIQQKKVVRYHRVMQCRGRPPFGEPRHYVELKDKVRISEAFV